MPRPPARTVEDESEYVQLAYELGNVCRPRRAEVLTLGQVEFCLVRHLITEIYVKTVRLCKKLLEDPRLGAIRQERQPQHNKLLASFRCFLNQSHEQRLGEAFDIDFFISNVK